MVYGHKAIVLFPLGELLAYNNILSCPIFRTIKNLFLTEIIEMVSEVIGYMLPL